MVKIVHMGSYTGLLDQILEKSYVHIRGHSFDVIYIEVLKMFVLRNLSQVRHLCH